MRCQIDRGGGLADELIHDVGGGAETDLAWRDGLGVMLALCKLSVLAETVRLSGAVQCPCVRRQL